MTRLLLAVALSMACGGSSSTEEGATEEGSSGGEDDWGDDWGDEDVEPSVESHGGAIEHIGISGPEKPWAEMTHEEREWYMVGKVLPIMKEQFSTHNAERWSPSAYGCETCHGPDMREVNYAMPAQRMYQVPEPGTQAWTNMERIFPAVVQFMKETVTPTMGTLLGIEDYTCFHCHPRAG